MSGDGAVGAVRCFAGLESAGEDVIPLWVPIGPRPDGVQTLFTTREGPLAALHPSIEVDFGSHDED